MKIQFIALLLLLSSIGQAVKEPEIRSKSILLPISQTLTPHKIEYVTEAYGGCYHWSTNQPTVLDVRGDTTKDNCQPRAIVKLNHEGSFLSPLSISAQDRDSNIFVNASVRLAKVAKIEIVTKFRVMGVGQVVEFYVAGYDSQHNTFSSLKGFKFEWAIVQNEAIVERVKIRDSQIHQETDYRKNLQALNHDTDMFVLRGLKIGQLKLRTKLRQPRYENIEAEIIVSVQERFEIQPGTLVYLLANSNYRFNLLDAKFKQIILPNSNYKFSLSNNEFTITRDLEIRTPNSDSHTFLIVEDTRTNPPFRSEVEIYSYRPDEMLIKSRDYIMVGQENQYSVDFYRNGKQLRGTVPYDIRSQELQINKEKKTIKGNKKTVAFLRATYFDLVAEKTVLVTLPLKSILMENEVVLPIGQTFQLYVVGGSQDYKYSIEGDQATITQNGIIKAQNKGKGFIVVTDSKDSNNVLRIPLRIDAVRSLRSLEERKEIALGNSGQLALIAEAEGGGRFTDCSDVDVSLASISSNVKQIKINRDFSRIADELRTDSNNKPLKQALDQLHNKSFDSVRQFSAYVQGNYITAEKLDEIVRKIRNFGICVGLQLQGTAIKEDNIRVKLTNAPNIQTPPVTVRVFDRIANSVLPKGTSLLMTPKSVYNWLAAGGPTSWQSDPIIEVNGKRFRDRDSIMIECGDKVETLTYTVRIHNQPSNKLLRPTVSENAFKVDCRYPSEIKIEALNTSISKRQLVLGKNQPFSLTVRAFDQLGNPFHENSNMEYQWIGNGVKQRTSKEPFEFELTSSPRHTIKVTSDHIKNNRHLSYPTVSDEISLHEAPSFSLRSQGRVIQEEITLVEHPFNKLILDFVDGSGNFRIDCQSEAVRCLWFDQQRQLEITPVRVGKAQVKIVDAGMYGSPTKLLRINVVSPHKMILSSNATKLQEGSYVKATARVFSRDGLEIDASQFKFLNLAINSDCICRQADKTLSTVTYQLLQKGSCTIYGYLDKISQVGSRIESENTIKLDIYSKFMPNLLNLKERVVKGVTFHESSMNIAMGCNAYLTFSGGPDRPLDIKYTIEPNNVVTVNMIDDRTYEFITKKEGDAIFHLILSENGTVISETQISMAVRRITGLEIAGLFAGRREIHQGAQIRLLPKVMVGSGVAADSFCPLSYEWKTADKEIVQLGEWAASDERYSNSGVNITALDKGNALIELIARLHGKQLGRTKATIKVIPMTQASIPTYIGQPEHTSTYMIIPPNSGFSFPENQRVRLISPCDKALTAHQNTIQSGEERKAVGIQVSSTEDEATTYTTVLITPIHSLIISNPTGVLNLQVDGRASIRFYLQDSFGRLFPNKLHNVNYNIRVSNPHVIMATLSENHIDIKGMKNGSSQLVVTVEGADIYDTIPIRVGHLIRPSSPVYVHEGGIINYEIQEGEGEWFSESPSILSINRESGVALAHSTGAIDVIFKSTVVLRSRAHVFHVTNIHPIELTQQLNYQNIQQKNISFKLIWRNPSTEELRSNLNCPGCPVNHNLRFKCEAKNPEWFAIGGGIATVGQNQIPYCSVRVRNDPPNAKIPENLILTATLDSPGSSFKLSQVHTFPFHFQFTIAENNRNMDFNPEYVTANISIKSNEQLVVDPKPYITTYYSPELRLQYIKFDFIDQKELLRSTVKVRNSATGQQETLNIRYDPDGRGRPSEGSWFTRAFSWTDIVIFGMIVLMGLLYFNYRADERPKVL